MGHWLRCLSESVGVNPHNHPVLVLQNGFRVLGFRVEGLCSPTHPRLITIRKTDSQLTCDRKGLGGNVSYYSIIGDDIGVSSGVHAPTPH